MTTYTLYWISEDGQDDIYMGEFQTRKEAEEGQLNAELDLIAEAADQEELDKIVAGWWSISENKGDGEMGAVRESGGH
jgi:4-hydroxyphenylpyruvate dioxygenase-like putative hemolysin